MAQKPTAKLKLNKPLGNMPVMQFLRPSDLRIDPSYQRSAAGGDSQTLIRRIAQRWNWDLCLPLVVARRQGMIGPVYFVIDGQHRLEAARVRGDIDQLPCVVLTYESVADEAANFVALNQQRKPLTKLDIFKAAIASGDKEACAIISAMEDAGLSVAPHANPTSWKPGMVSNIAGIENAWRRYGETVTSVALRVLGQAYAGQVLQYAGTIFPGIALVCFNEQLRQHGFPEPRLEKFVTMIAIRSQADWRREISRARVEQNLNGTSGSETVLHEAWQRAAADAPIIKSEAAETAASSPAPPAPTPSPQTFAPSGGRTFTGYAWCDQCDRKVDSKEANTCRDRFCKLRAAA